MVWLTVSDKGRDGLIKGSALWGNLRPCHGPWPFHVWGHRQAKLGQCPVLCWWPLWDATKSVQVAHCYANTQHSSSAQTLASVFVAQKTTVFVAVKLNGSFLWGLYTCVHWKEPEMDDFTHSVLLGLKYTNPDTPYTPGKKMPNAYIGMHFITQW